MSHWLDPLAAALDDAPEPVDVFFRDDDAGWDDASLYRLLDVFAPSGTPIDVAVIPTSATPDLARELLDRSVDGVRVHQHGYAHANHQTEGRKCEFGSARSHRQHAADVAAGQAQLRSLFGDALDPVFTPPWNRCEPTLVNALEQEGIRVLSRDITAPVIDHPTVVEVPVTVDWFSCAKGRPWSLTEIGRRLGESATTGRVGLMLHHAVTGTEELVRIGELVDLVAHHPRAHRSSLAELAAAGGHAPD